MDSETTTRATRQQKPIPYTYIKHKEAINLCGGVE
jgi:hypothetical protein